MNLAFWVRAKSSPTQPHLPGHHEQTTGDGCAIGTRLLSLALLLRLRLLLLSLQRFLLWLRGLRASRDHCHPRLLRLVSLRIVLFAVIRFGRLPITFLALLRSLTARHLALVLVIGVLVQVLVIVGLPVGQRLTPGLRRLTLAGLLVLLLLVLLRILSLLVVLLLIRTLLLRLSPSAHRHD